MEFAWNSPLASAVQARIQCPRIVFPLGRLPPGNRSEDSKPSTRSALRLTTFASELNPRESGGVAVARAGIERVRHGRRPHAPHGGLASLMGQITGLLVGHQNAPYQDVTVAAASIEPRRDESAMNQGGFWQEEGPRPGYVARPPPSTILLRYRAARCGWPEPRSAPVRTGRNRHASVNGPMHRPPRLAIVVGPTKKANPSRGGDAKPRASQAWEAAGPPKGASSWNPPNEAAPPPPWGCWPPLWRCDSPPKSSSGCGGSSRTEAKGEDPERRGGGPSSTPAGHGFAKEGAPPRPNGTGPPKLRRRFIADSSPIHRSLVHWGP